MLDRIRVAKIEEKPLNNNTTLYMITGTDGSIQSQFSDKVDLSEVKEGMAYEFTIELDRSKKYRNITAFRALTHQEDAAFKEVEVAKPDSTMSKSEWAQKDRRTQASIEGQVSLKELGESLRAGLWSGKELDEFSLMYDNTIRRLLKEWEKASDAVQIKPSTDAKIPEDIELLIARGKTICALLKLDWDGELNKFAIPQKAATTPYPSRSLLESLIKELRRKIPNEDRL